MHVFCRVIITVHGFEQLKAILVKCISKREKEREGFIKRKKESIK